MVKILIEIGYHEEGGEKSHWSGKYVGIRLQEQLDLLRYLEKCRKLGAECIIFHGRTGSWHIPNKHIVTIFGGPYSGQITYNSIKKAL